MTDNRNINQMEQDKHIAMRQYNPWKVVVFYLVLGGLWILLSDKLLALIVPDEVLYMRFQLYKGWFYVLVTGLLLYWMIRLDYRKIQGLLVSDYEKAQEIISTYEEISAMDEELAASLRNLTEVMEDLQAQKRFNDAIFDHSNALIIIWTLDNGIKKANPAYQSLVGSKEPLKGPEWLKKTVPEYHVGKVQDIVKILETEGYAINCEHDVLDYRGQVHHLLWNHVLVNDPNTDEKMVIGFGVDVTKERMKDKKLIEMLYTDHLTGIANRMAFEHDFMDRVNQEQACSVFLIGIRQFKRFNDLHGYQYGDMFLTRLANHLKKEIQAIKFYRWSGDEFLAVSDETDRDKLDAQIKGILEACHGNWQLWEVEYQPKVKIGIACFPKDGLDTISILKNVDMALHKAKTLREQDYMYYNQTLMLSLAHRTTIERELEVALEQDLLELYYQPIYDLKTGDNYVYEVLLRWQTPHARNIGEVIEIAEQSGQIRKVDEWVIAKAFSVLWSFQEAGQPIRLSINLSVQSFLSKSIKGYIESQLERYPIHTANVEFEITEYSLIEDLETTLENMQRLKAMGFRIALDDFGTRYSSLNYISKLPFDVLKIDKTYIDYIHNNPADQIIVEAIIQLANRLGLDTVGEGIETLDQETLLKSFGCRFGQGYLHAKPMAHEALLDIVDGFQSS